MIKKIFLILGILTTTTLAVAIPATVNAQVDLWGKSACSGVSSDLCSKKNNTNTSGIVKPVIEILLYVAGIVSVIVVIIAGIMMATSQGDPSKFATAQKALLYAIIGLVIAVFALGIVQYVYGKLK